MTTLTTSLAETTASLASSNVISLDDVRSYAGCCNHVSRLLWTWRPFLDELWGAIYSTGASRAPPNCIWKQQIASALDWIAAFLAENVGSLTRSWALDRYVAPATDMLVIFDASPWGIGSYLVINGVISNYMLSKLTKHDESVLRITIGDPRAQQIVELLSLLVSLVIWAPILEHSKCQLRLRGDNVSALTAAVKLKAASGMMRFLARELAFTFSRFSFEPDIVQHVPGIANITADALSRCFCPATAYTIPKCLQQVVRTNVPARVASWYHTSSYAARQVA